MNRFVPTFFGPNGPWTSGVVGRRRRRVVLALSLGSPDRMDRWQVQDVKSHARDVIEPVDAIAKSTVASRIRGARAGEHFVPGTKARSLWVDHDDQF